MSPPKFGYLLFTIFLFSLTRLYWPFGKIYLVATGRNPRRKLNLGWVSLWASDSLRYHGTKNSWRRHCFQFQSTRKSFFFCIWKGHRPRCPQMHNAHAVEQWGLPVHAPLNLAFRLSPRRVRARTLGGRFVSLDHAFVSVFVETFQMSLQVMSSGAPASLCLTANCFLTWLTRLIGNATHEWLFAIGEWEILISFTLFGWHVSGKITAPPLLPSRSSPNCQGGTVPTSVTCPQQTMMSEPRPRFWPISEAGPWGFEDAHARCHGDRKVNEALRSIMRWLTLSSFTTYPCILRKNGQYTACRGHFMLSYGTIFSSLVLRVFKRCQGKVGQFNTIWIGQVPSFVPMISGKSLPRPDGPTFYIWPCQTALAGLCAWRPSRSR